MDIGCFLGPTRHMSRHKASPWPSQKPRRLAPQPKLNELKGSNGLNGGNEVFEGQESLPGTHEPASWYYWRAVETLQEDADRRCDTLPRARLLRTVTPINREQASALRGTDTERQGSGGRRSGLGAFAADDADDGPEEQGGQGALDHTAGFSDRRDVDPGDVQSPATEDAGGTARHVRNEKGPVPVGIDAVEGG